MNTVIHPMDMVVSSVKLVPYPVNIMTHPDMPHEYGHIYPVNRVTYLVNMVQYPMNTVAYPICVTVFDTEDLRGIHCITRFPPWKPCYAVPTVSTVET